jgi:hypothetical protein
MAKAHFTAGPWKIADHFNHAGQLPITSPTGEICCITKGGLGDARLIAASPCLLEACQQFMSYADSGKHPTNLSQYAETIAGSKMRAAIAKATGETS